MSRPAVRSEEDLSRSILRRLRLVERRLATTPGRTIPTQGSTALRDATYGVPATDAQRVALANQVPTWFNTDLGWWETYYAQTGLPGLTARGLYSNHASGWFPQGGAPIYATLRRSNSNQSVDGNGALVQFDTYYAIQGFGNPSLPRNSLSPLYGGFYHIEGSVVCAQSGGNYFDLHIRVNGSILQAESGTVFPHTNAYSRANMSGLIAAVAAGQPIDLMGASSSAGNMLSGALLTVRYAGPPLTPS